jgi:hypothetical protein
MDLQKYVRDNKKVIAFIKNAVPGAIDKYVGTLDYATARFNTVLIKLSQDPLLLDKVHPEVQECFDAIQSFHYFTKKYLAWPYWLKPVATFMLYIIGTLRIPKVKFLLEKINN